jgi:hypothetical protein
VNAYSFIDTHLGIAHLTYGVNGSKYSFILDYPIWGPRQKELDDWLGLEEIDMIRHGLLICYDDPSFGLMFQLKWG